MEQSSQYASRPLHTEMKTRHREGRLRKQHAWFAYAEGQFAEREREGIGECLNARRWKGNLSQLSRSSLLCGNIRCSLSRCCTLGGSSVHTPAVERLANTTTTTHPTHSLPTHHSSKGKKTIESLYAKFVPINRRCTRRSPSEGRKNSFHARVLSLLFLRCVSA